jgi:hypothetical protein
LRRLLLLVEGQTEEAFGNLVLKPHLAYHNVHVERASMLRTREQPIGSLYKGGVTSFARMARDARRLLGDTNAVVTTMIDYYRLPADFPGIAQPAGPGGVRAKVERLEAEFAAAIGNTRFRPYLMLHEFEAMIFAVPAAAETHLQCAGLAQALQQAADQCGGCELVNDGPTTHPSSRLAQASLSRRYGKVADGPEILLKAGLATIRSACPHFDTWLSWAEALGR